MRGIHRTGDFGYNGYNGDVCQTVGEIPKNMNGLWDDVTGWFKESITDPIKKANQAEAEKAQLQVTQQKLIMYASIAVAIFVAYSFLKKQKVL